MRMRKSKYIAWILILSFLCSLTGCNGVVYDKKECETHINEFVRIFLDRDREELCTACALDETLEATFQQLKQDPFVDKVMEKTTCQIYTDNIQQINGKVTCDCFFSIPDYTSAYRNAPQLGDLDYFREAIEKQSASSYVVTEVSITFWVVSGYWVLENIRDIVSEIYTPMFDVLKEGRKIEQIVVDSKDEGAIYNKVDLSDAAFFIALAEAGDKSVDNLTTLEGSELKKNGYDSDSVVKVTKATSADGISEYTHILCNSQPAAWGYFKANTVASTNPSEYYASSDWGYYRTSTDSEMTLIYWRRARIIILELHFRSGMEEQDFGRSLRFMQALAII